MNRSIEIRLRRLEAASAPVESPRRVHQVLATNDQERDAAIADLVTAAVAGPDDLFICYVPAKPEATSAMHDNYWWDENAGHWVPKDGRDDAAIARLSAGTVPKAVSR